MTAAKRDVSSEARGADGRWATSASSGPVTIGHPSGSPVSESFTIEGKGPAAEEVKGAVAAIGRVHRLGDAKKIPIIVGGLRSGQAVGMYTHSVEGEPLKINIQGGDDPFLHQQMTTVHEIGHYLEGAYFSSGEKQAGVMAAIEGTARVAAMREIGKKGHVVVAYPGGRRVKEPMPKKYTAYRLLPEELFAEAYTHYITFRSKSAGMAEEYRKQALMQGITRFPSVWSEAEFEPVAKAFDDLFQKAGWKI